MLTFSGIYLSSIYKAINPSKFTDSFKFTNIATEFKQASRNPKDNYRPINILPLISKILEKLICKQLSNNFDNILQHGFKNFNMVLVQSTPLSPFAVR